MSLGAPRSSNQLAHSSSQILRGKSRNWFTHLHVSEHAFVLDDDAKMLSRSVDAANSEDVRRAVVDAHAAFESGEWSRAPAIHRSNVLTRLARALEERVPSLAELETLQTGRAVREMRAQLGRLPEWL